MPERRCKAVGWLAFQIARGHGSHEANQKGALAAIAAHSYGVVLLWVLGIGFAAYALWRLSEAGFGTAAEGNKTGARVQSLVRGLIYAALAVSTFSFLAGTSKQSQSQQQETATARLMKHGYGRWLVGLIGLIVVAVGVAMIIEGTRKKFAKQLRMGELHGSTRTVVLRLGMIGTIARGVVFAVTGALSSMRPSPSTRASQPGRCVTDTGRPALRTVASRGARARTDRVRAVRVRRGPLGQNLTRHATARLTMPCHRVDPVMTAPARPAGVLTNTRRQGPGRPVVLVSVRNR